MWNRHLTSPVTLSRQSITPDVLTGLFVFNSLLITGLVAFKPENFVYSHESYIVERALEKTNMEHFRSPMLTIGFSGEAEQETKSTIFALLENLSAKTSKLLDKTY